MIRQSECVANIQNAFAGALQYFSLRFQIVEYSVAGHNHIVNTLMRIMHGLMVLQWVIDVDGCLRIRCESTIQQLFAFASFQFTTFLLLLPRLKCCLEKKECQSMNVMGLECVPHTNLPANVVYRISVDQHAFSNWVVGKRALWIPIHPTDHNCYETWTKTINWIFGHNFNWIKLAWNLRIDHCNIS